VITFTTLVMVAASMVIQDHYQCVYNAERHGAEGMRLCSSLDLRPGTHTTIGVADALTVLRSSAQCMGVQMLIISLLWSAMSASRVRVLRPADPQ
jgi:hypothetical protein